MKVPRSIRGDDVEDNGDNWQVTPSMSIIRVFPGGRIDADGINGDVEEVEHYAKTLLACCRRVRRDHE